MLAIEKIEECTINDIIAHFAWIVFPGLFLEQGKGRRGLDLAIADLEESLSLKADNVDVQCMLASCYEKNGQKVKAVAAYQNSLALDPDFSEAKKGLSKVES